MSDASKRISRRSLLGGAALASTGVAAARWSASAAPMASLLTQAGTPVAMADALALDLSSEPANLDPATTYEVNGWSIIHSIYDSLIQYDTNGQLQGVAAESLTQTDPLTWEAKLRAGLTFHDGTKVDASSVTAGWRHIVNSQTSSIKGNFATIANIEATDDLTAKITLSAPSPWLPAQIAQWLVLLPPNATDDSILKQPNGTGPYSFVEWKPGEQITLDANPNYPTASAKGQPVAKRVTFRFVAEPSTRVADLLSGTAGVIRGVPVDQQEPIDKGGAQVVVDDVVGTSFIRLPNDVAPFTDARVRQSLNYAVDKEGIISALNGGYGKPLASFFPPGGLGYSAGLQPFAYDPDKAKALLKEAGVGEFEATLEYASTERADLSEAIAAQLSDIGVKATAKAVEVATFNADWKDQSAPPLRYASWRPMFDPYTLLFLIVSKDGYLSRFNSATVQPLLDQAAIETDAAKRAELYVQLAKALQDDPAGIYLWSLTSIYGSATGAPAWTPRPDDVLLPTKQP
jgi:peptide/nickel transport system substrate-binding protein